MSNLGTTLAAGGDPFLTDDKLRLLGEVAAYGAMVETVAAGMHGALTIAPQTIRHWRGRQPPGGRSVAFSRT